MLIKLLEKTQFMAVFFYDEDCMECETVLEALEEIDDEADMYGIDFVKSDDEYTAKSVGGVFSTPALVYFRKSIPLVYDGGDLSDSEKVLAWLTSEDVFSTGDEIEDVNRHMLDKLLNEDDFVAVYFYSDVCPSCKKVLEGLESIDQETDALDITFVKINDPRYAKKYGVNKIPALVYFRKKFPSIYRDDLLDESEVLTWLRSNRYKKVELDWIMYTVLSTALAFLLYSAFLIYGLKPKEAEKKVEDE
jgi:thiol-disulfide isomerase/thioredoxin